MNVGVNGHLLKNNHPIISLLQLLCGLRNPRELMRAPPCGKVERATRNATPLREISMMRLHISVRTDIIIDIGHFIIPWVLFYIFESFSHQR